MLPLKVCTWCIYRCTSLLTKEGNLTPAGRLPRSPPRSPSQGLGFPTARAPEEPSPTFPRRGCPSPSRVQNPFSPPPHPAPPGRSRGMHLAPTPHLGGGARVSLAPNSPPEPAGPSPGRGAAARFGDSAIFKILHSANVESRCLEMRLLQNQF